MPKTPLLRLNFLLLLRKRRVIAISAGLIVVFVILTAMFAFGGKEHEHPSQSGKDSMPVNAKLEGNGIQFETEVVKPVLNGQSYFVNYRLQREQARQEAKAMLSPLLNSNVDKAREQAQVKWLELTKKIEKEEEIENFLKIKGFQDLIADVNPDSISIIIYASSLTPNEVSLIQDAVTRITKIRLDKISISYKK